MNILMSIAVKENVTNQKLKNKLNYRIEPHPELQAKLDVYVNPYNKKVGQHKHMLFEEEQEKKNLLFKSSK